MTRHRILACSLIALGLLTLFPGAASAIPAFARKYGVNCTMCHSAFPRLNDFGQRYRANGYQLPGRESEDKTVLESPPPFALRTSGGYSSHSATNNPGVEEVSEFQLNGLDLLSAGLFARNIGYLVVYPPQINPTRGVEGQDGTLEMASVVFSNLGSSWVNLRVGRFEPAYVALSAKRRLTISPYEIYDFASPGGLALSETQDGIELTGQGHGFSYAAGYVNGSPSNLPDDQPADVYLRAAMVFGQGEGQTAGHRVGVFGYRGEARPGEGLEDQGTESFSRYGVDASLNFGQVNASAQYLKGQDDGMLWGSLDDVDFCGGLAELSFMPMTRLVGFVRYDWVDTPSGVAQDISRWTAGGRFYLVDNLALHLEYSEREQDQVEAPKAKDTLVTVRLDFAF